MHIKVKVVHLLPCYLITTTNFQLQLTANNVPSFLARELKLHKRGIPLVGRKNRCQQVLGSGGWDDSLCALRVSCIPCFVEIPRWFMPPNANSFQLQNTKYCTVCRCARYLMDCKVEQIPITRCSTQSFEQFITRYQWEEAVNRARFVSWHHPHVKRKL